MSKQQSICSAVELPPHLTPHHGYCSYVSMSSLSRSPHMTNSHIPNDSPHSRSVFVAPPDRARCTSDDAGRAHTHTCMHTHTQHEEHAPTLALCVFRRGVCGKCTSVVHCCVCARCTSCTLLCRTVPRWTANWTGAPGSVHVCVTCCDVCLCVCVCVRVCVCLFDSTTTPRRLKRRNTIRVVRHLPSYVTMLCLVISLPAGAEPASIYIDQVRVVSSGQDDFAVCWARPSV